MVILGWVLVVAAAALLRFHHLGDRPFHADEATGARITADRMETQGGRFDPTHFHGPLLGDAAGVACRLRGETTWKSMRKATLRSVTACAGLLVVLVPWFWRRRMGEPGALLAAALLGCSPLLAYYSRMFIHEMWLVLFGLLVLTTLQGRFRPLAAGLFLGLMFATKESFAISVIAWSAAALPIAWERRGLLTPLHRWWKPVVLLVLVALLVSMAFYTHGFRHPHGAADAVMTYFRYQVVEGHDKPFGYYGDLIAVPRKAGGVWWFGTPVVALALAAFAAAHRRDMRGDAAATWARFLGYAVVGHLLIYSLISYKTPWLACLPWAQLCLLAGFVFRLLPCPSWRVAVGAVAAFALVSQTRQTTRATGRLSSDARNPYAYVPTRRDVEKLATWLDDLQSAMPGIPLGNAAVIGSDYWPLPWYLRKLDPVGYWPEPPDTCATMPLVFVMPDAAEKTMERLEESHVAVPRGLRDGVPLIVCIRNDVWERWMNSGD